MGVATTVAAPFTFAFSFQFESEGSAKVSSRIFLKFSAKFLLCASFFLDCALIDAFVILTIAFVNMIAYFNVASSERGQRKSALAMAS